MGTMNGGQYFRISKLTLFLALSRTPHGLLDICTPLFVVLLWLGHLPETRTSILGIIAALGGYTAVYALNDIVDYRSDREKISQTDQPGDEGYLDAVFVRHPLARGYLSMSEAVLWASGWAIISLSTASLLNPVCAFILVIGCALEAFYCLLLRISHLRTLLSGIVKTLGGLAAIFAVDPSPDPVMLALLFFWLFFWEIGGQNIPADWHDITVDSRLGAKTVPVAFGPGSARYIVLVALVVSFVISALLLWIAPLRLSPPLYIAALVSGFYLLILPALRLFGKRDRVCASILFNRASWYPCALLAVAAAQMIWRC